MTCACMQNPVRHTGCSQFRPFHMQPQRGGKTLRKLRLWQFNPILVEVHDAVGASGLSMACAECWEGENGQV